MAIKTLRVLVQVALRTLQLSGSDQAELLAAYDATALDGAEWPVNAMRDAVLAVEAELHELVANDRANPYRSFIYGRSSNLISGALLPTTDNDDIRFIGIYSGVNDGADHQPLLEGSMQELIRFARGNYTTEIRKYKITGGRLFHSRPNTRAYIEGCVFSRTAAFNRFGTGGNSPLPESFESLWVARTIAYLVKEGWLVQEANFYLNFAASGIERLKARETEMPTLPGMDSNANAVTN